MVCKFIDDVGLHLRIFNFEINTGLIGTEILREQLVGDVNVEDHAADHKGDDHDDQILDLGDKEKMK